MGLKIGENTVSKSQKTDLALNMQEIHIDTSTAVGECTGSDPKYSEARLLIERMEVLEELGSIMYAGLLDPA